MGSYGLGNARILLVGMMLEKARGLVTDMTACHMPPYIHQPT